MLRAVRVPPTAATATAAVVGPLRADKDGASNSEFGLRVNHGSWQLSPVRINRSNSISYHADPAAAGATKRNSKNDESGQELELIHSAYDTLTINADF